MLRRRALALARACESHAVTHARVRAVQTSARTSAGMGPAVRATTAPVAELPEDAELTWDAGDAHPEPCLDNVPPKIVSKNTAAMYLTGAIAFLGGVYTMAIVVDKPSTTPFAPKTFPYNGLEVELGGRKAT